MAKSNSAELDSILESDVSAVKTLETSAFDNLAGGAGKPLVLFGAGGIGRKTLAGMRKHGIEVLAFADNNPAAWGKTIEGVKVLSVVDAAAAYGKTAVFVITIWKGEATDRMGDHQRQLEKLGCTSIIPFGYLYWKYPETFLPHYSLNSPHHVYEQREDVTHAFALLSDEASRREYLAQIRWRALLDFDSLPDPVKDQIYFPKDIVKPLPDELFIDCGAFDGDTLQHFINARRGQFAGVVAFEPDPKNYLALEKYVASLADAVRGKIAIHQAAVGAKTGKVYFNAQGNEASFVGAGDLEVNCLPLDTVLAGRKVTHLKMDIEGSEPDAILGAKNTIAQSRPILSVCVYHQQDHLWRIPLLIDSMVQDYRYFLRPHLLEVWDLVLYAIPAERLKE